MTTQSSPPIALPFVHRPENAGREQFTAIVMCVFFAVAVVVVGIMAFTTLAKAGHWFRLLVPTLMLLCWWLVTWAIVASYRRGAAVWRIDLGEVERAIEGTSTFVALDQVTCLRVRPKSAILDAPGQRALALPKPAARALARSHLIDYMLERIESTIQSEGAWCVRARPWIGALHVAGGLALVGVAFSSFFHLGHMGHAVKMISDGRRFFGRGLVVTSTGIKTGPHDFSTIPWSDIRAAEAGPGGLVIETLGGQTLRVSPYADNYVPLVAYIDRLLSEPGEASPGDELWPEFSE